MRDLMAAKARASGYARRNCDLPREIRTTGYLRMAPWWVDS
jgi:hypothetical protein